MSLGYLCIAQNSNNVDYLRMAYLQALSCKLTQWKELNSFSVIVDKETADCIEQKHIDVFDNIIANNPLAASGGGAGDSDDDVRLKSLGTFLTQQRTVTADDYLIRTLSLPSQYGSIAKAYITSDTDLALNLKNDVSGFVDYDNNTTSTNNSIDNYFRKINYDVTNPFSVNLYVLGYNSNKNLTQINEALFYNIKQYLKKYRLLTDGINIIDGYIIASLELQQRLIPFIIRRPIPGGGCEYWNLKDLEVIAY